MRIEQELDRFGLASRVGGLVRTLSGGQRRRVEIEGVMNFVIFPVFFASTVPYPLWHMSDANAVLGEVARLEPFSHAVELIRVALYGRLEAEALLITVLVGRGRHGARVGATTAAASCAATSALPDRASSAAHVASRERSRSSR